MVKKESLASAKILKKLQKAEESLRGIVELSTNLFYVHTVDHVLTYVSPQSREFFDCDPEEALIKWTDFITDHPLNRTAVKITQKAIDSGKRQPPYQVECIGKKGRKIWVEVNETPLLDNGKTVAIVGSLTDITPYKKTEQKLRESEERYRRLYSETPAMLHSIGADGRLVSVSNCWLETLGYQRAEVLNRRTTEFLTQESKEYAQKVILPEFFRTGSCHNVPYQFLKKDGDVIDVLLSAVAEKDEQGQVVRSLAVMTDVTQRNQAERKIEEMNQFLTERARQLEEANKDLEAFSYCVSHDLRKPLTIISGYAQALQEFGCSESNENCKKFLEILLNNVKEMDDLIDIVLDFSKLKDEKNLQKKQTNLSDIAHTVLSELAGNDPFRRVSIDIKEGVSVRGDPKLLRIVMENILGNAWKYTQKKKKALIEFGSEEVDTEITCYVKDNGVGFHMSNAQDLFKPFARLHSSDEYSGYGVGLSTVERIISKHGGKVWAESAPDKGATFYFSLKKNGMRE